MVQHANLFSTCLFLHVCPWKPRTVFFSVSCSDALPGSQWPSPPLFQRAVQLFVGGLCVASQSYSWQQWDEHHSEVFIPFGSPWWVCPSARGFYYHSAVHIPNTDLLGLKPSQCKWHKSLAVTGSSGKGKSWPAEQTTIPCCSPSRTGLGYEVRQCRVLCLPCSYCRHSPAATPAGTLPFPQGSSLLKCHTNNRIRVIVGHRKFQGTSLNSANEGNVSLPSHLTGSLEKQAFCNREITTLFTVKKLL